jgi:hypothetical protein
MPDDPLPRRLTTIVALDVGGYSARTEADEAKTTAEVAALRRVIEGIATACQTIVRCSSSRTACQKRSFNGCHAAHR